MKAKAITDLVASVTKDWSKQRKAEERHARSAMRRRDALVYSRRTTIKDAAYEVMRSAYLKASANGTLPAHARQVMYAARGDIQSATGRALDDQYFTQTLLPDYITAYGCDDWDVVFDARGHFTEPHTGSIVPLGTLEVRRYIRDIADSGTPGIDIDIVGLSGAVWPTCGPRNRYSAILFIEKEGFMPLFDKVRLAQRYDIAIMSTKGMSVTAARLLVDTLCEDGVPLLVLHDFDKSGFSIASTLQRNTRRYQYENEVNLIDLGIRLDDVVVNGLESESVSYGRADPRQNLVENGATAEEVAFLCGDDDVWHGYRGQRVELNAFTSDKLVAWIEAKLKLHGIAKVMPSPDDLALAYRRAFALEYVRKSLKDISGEAVAAAESAEIPEELMERLATVLAKNPEMPWDKAVVRLLPAGDRDRGGRS
jgi:hypothetical protein